MEKKTIEVDEIDCKIYNSRDGKCTIPIDELFRLISSSKERGANVVELIADIDWDMRHGDDITITTLKTRLETDEEFAIRKSKHEANLKLRQERQMKKDLAEYKRLKKIFEGV